MNRKAWAAAAVVGALMPTVAGATNAQQLTAFAIAGGNDESATASFTPGADGGLTINGTNDFLQGKLGQGTDTNTSIFFSNMTNGAYTLNSDGSFSQILNPDSTSSFTITDTATHTVLLSGTLDDANLTGFNGASSGNVNLLANSVTFTGGTYFPTGFSPTNGALAIEFTSTSPFSATSTGLGAFTAVDGITFSALNTRGGGGGGGGVPEPASTASLGIGGLFLIGALLRKRRSTPND